MRYSPFPDAANASSQYVNSDSDKNFVHPASPVIIRPNQGRIIKLKDTHKINNSRKYIFCPLSTKLNLNLNYSLHEPSVNNSILIYIHNNIKENITLRKKIKLGFIKPVTDEGISTHGKEIIFQVNSLNCQDILQLRKSELHKDNFQVSHLPEVDKKRILSLLMENSAVFSTSYDTLGCTDKVTPEFKLLHDFALQTKPYPIPKIAKILLKKKFHHS